MIPRPLQSEEHGAGADLSCDTVIVTAPELSAVADWTRSVLGAASGWPLPIDDGLHHHDPALTFRLDQSLAPEEYRLDVDPAGVTIVAAGTPGAFYGAQSLRQLLPRQALLSAPEPSADPATTRWHVPGVHIVDRPRFGWRGAHLDVARHFMPLPWIKRFVDLMALHKLNVLHLHLTDDQGWRIEIEGYPLLTAVGSKRPESVIGYYPQHGYDGVPHGGYYSKTELRELVDYAAIQQVRVVPEIDMPGHMAAAIAAYPLLGNGISPPAVRIDWGISTDVLNVEQSTVEVIKAVLAEVLEVFDDPYVHIGGDECPTDQWLASPRAQQLMRERGLTDERDLQGWFLAQITDFLTANGRITVGWDELLESGAQPGTVIMAWRSAAEGVAAARAGHKVVMAPAQATYLDWAESAEAGEPPTQPGGVTTLADTYAFDPIPADLEPTLHDNILGAQFQLWTEYMADPRAVEYLAFPRACAVAEAAWSPAAKDFADFRERLADHLTRLDVLDVNYRPLSGPSAAQLDALRARLPSP
ncbi:MAG: beta-N-acetylhexosaminidase [Actinomycetota bacterium]|nr:beta-N-acetylhexosaminidase [Actinomycetota bacterium]